MPKVHMYTYKCQDCGIEITSVGGYNGCCSCGKLLCGGCAIHGGMCKRCFEELPDSLQKDYEEKASKRLYLEALGRKMWGLALVFFIPLMLTLAPIDQALLFVVPYLLVLFVIWVITRLMASPVAKLAPKIVRMSGKEPHMPGQFS